MFVSLRSGSRVLIVLGLLATSAWPQGLTLSDVHGPAATSDGFGSRVRFLGDLDADGVSDFAVFAPNHISGPAIVGRVSVHSGSDGALLWHVDSPPHPGTLTGFGRALAGADLNGDGKADLLVSAPNLPLNLGPLVIGTGVVFIQSGVDGSSLGSWSAPSFVDRYGESLAALGDVDGDGISEVVVGATDGSQGHGQVFVHSGAGGAILQHWTSPNTGDFFGASVDGGQDLDGDLVPDVIASAPRFPGSQPGNDGRVAAYSTASGALLWSRTEVSGPGLDFGRIVRFIPDANGDGIADVAVAPDAGGSSTLAVWLLSGADGSTLWSSAPGSSASSFAFSMASAGDLNADGRGDVIVGIPGDQGGGHDAGRAEVLSGLDGSVLVSFPGVPDRQLGWSVDGGADLNGDSFPDLILGMPTRQIANSTGRVRRAMGCGARPYAQSLGGLHTLDLGWTATGGPSGLLDISGATPLSSGLLGASANTAFIVPGALGILIDLTPGTFVTLPISFDGNGEFQLPLSLAIPSLAGTSQALQAVEFDSAGAVQASTKGLQLLFTKP